MIAIVCAAFGSAGGFAATVGFATVGAGGIGVTDGSGGGDGDFARMRTSRTGSSALKSVDSECAIGTNGACGAATADPSAANIGEGAGGGVNANTVGLATARVRGNPEVVGP